MSPMIAAVATPEFWSAVIAALAPLVLGVFGALICGRAGILPLSAEGVLTAEPV